MKKNKSTKAKNRKIVRFLFILFIILLITIMCCKKKEAYNNKILEANAREAFVTQSIKLADDLKNEYMDIESLEDDDTISFVSDAAIKTGKSEYYIRVNYGANCVNIYTKDDEKNYTVPYKAMICSTGISTPKSGTYQITYKYRWLRLFGNVYGQYSTRIVRNILFHSVPYFKQRADTLEYEEYDKLGTKASAGCIRLTVEDSKWIYDNIPSGTYVEFYSDPNNPGPLGKPKAQKISDNEECRNWDPTDPDKNNPWNGGSGIPSVTYTDTNNTSNKKSNTNTNSTNTNTNKNTTNSTNSTNTSNKTNTTINNDKTNNNTNNAENNKINTSNKPNKNNTEKNEVPNNTANTNTNTSTNTSTEKPQANTAPSTNTTTNNSNKEEDISKPVEKPNTDTSKPDTTTPVKPDDNKPQEKPKEPETPTSPETTTPETDSSTSTNL